MREPATTRRWMDEGTRIFSEALDRTGDDALGGPTALSGWTGRHLVAHVAANAEALLNLAHWARTGEETPMYPSPERRDADIAAGSRRAPADLRRDAEDSAVRLAAALDRLTDEQWSRTVRTAQGRQVPASEIPWLRAREVMVHATDLHPDLSLGSLPEDFQLALVDDVVAKRSTMQGPALELTTDDGRHTWKVAGNAEPTTLHGSLGAVATYLTGRPGADMAAQSGAVPDLAPWL